MDVRPENASDSAVRLERRAALQLRRHRIQPSRPVRGVKRAEAFVREQRVVIASGHASVPALTEAIAGAHLTGSWWSSGAPGTYGTMLALSRTDVIEAPVILGKGTFLDPLLGPALERIASDDKRRTVARRDLPDLAKRLLRDVESRGEIRMDRWGVEAKRSRPARVRLESALLVWSEDMHTDSGYHTAVVRPWATSAVSTRFAKDAARLGYIEARDELALAALAAAVVAPEREARRWFCFGGDWVDELLAAGRLERLTVGRAAWLVPPR